jgi:uncharacterized lipoprotein YddW (UPF0748 family)
MPTLRMLRRFFVQTFVVSFVIFYGGSIAVASLVIAGEKPPARFSLTIPAAKRSESSLPPKREFRAVWVASVFNINWPHTSTDAPAKQRREFIELLEECRASRINAVIVQIRPRPTRCTPPPASRGRSGSQASKGKPRSRFGIRLRL